MKNEGIEMRRNGMLLPIASLPSPYGIGGFSKEAYEFIDLLEETGQNYGRFCHLVLPAMEIPHINPFLRLQEIRILLIWIHWQKKAG